MSISIFWIKLNSEIFEISLQIFITDWWLCPELYLRRPFHLHGSSRLDALLEAKARQGVQVLLALLLMIAFTVLLISSVPIIHLHD